MKWFCTVHLSKAKINELVFAEGPKDAEAIARANVTILLQDWNERVMKVNVISFYELGEMACDTHGDIAFEGGDYFYCGRKINNDMNFINGFSHSYRKNAAQAALEDELIYRAVGNEE